MCGQPLSGSSLVRASSPIGGADVSCGNGATERGAFGVVGGIIGWPADGVSPRSKWVQRGDRGSCAIGETVKTIRDSSDSGALGRSVPRVVADEPTLPVRYRPTRKRSAARAPASGFVWSLWLLWRGLSRCLWCGFCPNARRGPAKETPATVIGVCERTWQTIANDCPTGAAGLYRKQRLQVRLPLLAPNRRE